MPDGRVTSSPGCSYCRRRILLSSTPSPGLPPSSDSSCIYILPVHMAHTRRAIQLLAHVVINANSSCDLMLYESWARPAPSSVLNTVLRTAFDYHTRASTMEITQLHNTQYSILYLSICQRNQQSKEAVAHVRSLCMNKPPNQSLLRPTLAGKVEILDACAKRPCTNPSCTKELRSGSRVLLLGQQITPPT